MFENKVSRMPCHAHSCATRVCNPWLADADRRGDGAPVGIVQCIQRTVLCGLCVRQVPQLGPMQRSMPVLAFWSRA